MDTVLELSHIRKMYDTANGTVSVLQDVSFSVSAGEFAAVIGPSGSGKSTLLNCAGCLDTPTAGTVRLCGTDMNDRTEHERAVMRNREIGFIFQAYHLLHRLTALENVALPLRYRGLPRSEALASAAEALEQVGLSHRAQYFPAQLSGGQQQRAAIARALIGNPKLLLADEPTGNLDPETGREMLALLKNACKAGSALLLITHDTQVAAQADRVFRLTAGRLEPSARPKPHEIMHLIQN